MPIKLQSALEAKGSASFIVAEASQFETLAEFGQGGFDLEQDDGFHLDESVPDLSGRFSEVLVGTLREQTSAPSWGLSFSRRQVDPDAECQRVSALIEKPSSMLRSWVGENGHLAFNDPPADFETERPYMLVDLDDACRQQQLGGWFPDFDSVRRRAISMSVRQIMKSSTIVCTVPDSAAEAVKNAQGPVTPEVPASILQEHPDCHLFLDAAAASLT